MTCEYSKFYYKLAFMFNKVLSSANSINPILILGHLSNLEIKQFSINFFHFTEIILVGIISLQFQFTTKS